MNNYGSRNQESIETRNAAESVIQRVYLAVQQLCIGQGDVRKRLITAIMTLNFLQENEFPEGLRSNFRWVISQATKYKSEYPQFRSDLGGCPRIDQ